MENNNVYVNAMRAAIYCRLSKDDEEREGESASIQNQRALLENYCEANGYRVVGVFQDDGFTGLNTNRPDFQKMLRLVEKKAVDIILTKDLSRLTRNATDAGILLDQIFPKKCVRYIAVNDGVDSESDNNVMVGMRCAMNQYYSEDVSRKVHSSYLTKAKQGKFTGCVAPFGYRKSADDKNRLEPDPDTAPIVEYIYSLAVEGKGANYIRRKLEDRQIPCPAWWNRQKGLRNKLTKFELENPETGRFIWDFTTIQEILQNPVYIGAIASQKQVYKFKTGWIKDKKPEDWIVVSGMHESIVSREVFDLVQEKVKDRKRPDAFGNFSIFAGLVKCGQCGCTLNIRRANQKGNERIYTCSRYNKYGVAHCSQHRIKYDVLYNLILEQIRGYARQAFENEGEIATALMRDNELSEQSGNSLIEKAISEDKARLLTLDKILTKLYEDYVAERINADNFNLLLSKNQAEQAAIKTRLDNNTSRLETREKQSEDNTRWLALIREYTDIRELDATTLNKLIQKIVVYEDIDGEVIRQTIEIHFNFINRRVKIQQ